MAARKIFERKDYVRVLLDLVGRINADGEDLPGGVQAAAKMLEAIQVLNADQEMKATHVWNVEPGQLRKVWSFKPEVDTSPPEYRVKTEYTGTAFLNDKPIKAIVTDDDAEVDTSGRWTQEEYEQDQAAEES